MRRTGDQGWLPRACAKQGLRSAMRLDPVESCAKRMAIAKRMETARRIADKNI